MAFNILLVWKKLPSLRLSGFYMLPRQFFFVYPPQHLRSGITFPIITQAVFVLVYLCDKTTLGRQDLISTPSISEALSIPKPSVVKILKALNRSGITGSGIGKKGGVSVLKAPEEIRLLDVFWAIEGNKPYSAAITALPGRGAVPGSPKRPVRAIGQSGSELPGPYGPTHHR
jgi:hypothetical protein